MKPMYLIVSALLVGSFLSGSSAEKSLSEKEKSMRCLEMRTYHLAPGKMENLHNRFRNHTLRLFEKHGIKSIGYWVPIDKPESKLIFLLEYPNRQARENAWKAFLADPDWIKAHKESEASGKIVEKADVLFLVPTDYSNFPEIKPGGENRVFELRTYTAAPGKLDALNARFRNHTVNLFSKHGMKHLAYGTPMSDQPGADNTLIYILAHDSREAAKASFDAFRADPDWVKARTASEANGPLTAPQGVKSEFLKATDYSPVK